MLISCPLARAAVSHSKTQLAAKAIFVASDISNAHKRKISSVGDKSASPQKSARTTVSKENE